PAGPAGPALVPPQAADQDGEIAWLLRVSAAYRDAVRKPATPRPAPVPTPKGTPS
ncbi:hypothetical protein HC023_18370, partial [Streptomyces sp. NEAU-H3]|nr:hypothetical protein [Streptomyces sp. NEAU-H3]